MKNTKEAERLADETLKSLDNIETAEVNEFLFTRVQNRLDMNAKAFERTKLRLVYRLAAALLLMILVNILTLKYITNENPNNNSYKATGVNAFADDYNLNENQNNY